MSPFLVSAIIISAYMMLWFCIAMWLKDNGVIDIAWGLGFAVIAWVLWFNFGTSSTVQLLFNGMITLWAVRLAGYLIIRRRRENKEDWRYKKWREEWGKWFLLRTILQVFVLQGVFMYVIALPIIAVNSSAEVGGLAWFQWVGIALFFFGWMYESVADYQLLQFKSKAENKGKILTSGLWTSSRHPNYFGEAVLWWGLFLVAIPYGNWYLLIVSPLLLTWTLTRLSGVPMLERKLKQRPEYQAYMKQTNTFLPKFW